MGLVIVIVISLSVLMVKARFFSEPTLSARSLVSVTHLDALAHGQSTYTSALAMRCRAPDDCSIRTSIEGWEANQGALDIRVTRRINPGLNVFLVEVPRNHKILLQSGVEDVFERPAIIVGQL